MQKEIYGGDGFQFVRFRDLTIPSSGIIIAKDNFTNEQFISLEKVLVDWKKKYPNAHIKGHKDTIDTRKTCPNFDVNEWCKKRGLI